MTKQIIINIEVEVDDNTTEEQIAEEVTKAFAAHKPEGGGKVSIRTTDKKKQGDALPTTYDTRMWEKITC